MPVGDFTLRPDKIYYIAASKSHRNVRVWIDGVPTLRKELESEIAESDFPLRLGNWYFRDRPFSGYLMEVSVSKARLLDEEVARRNRTVRAALQ